MSVSASPSTSCAEKVGTRASMRTELPFWREMERRWKRNLTVQSGSWPTTLTKPDPRLLMKDWVTGCHELLDWRPDGLINLSGHYRLDEQVRANRGS